MPQHLHGAVADERHRRRGRGRRTSPLRRVGDARAHGRERARQRAPSCPERMLAAPGRTSWRTLPESAAEDRVVRQSRREPPQKTQLGVDRVGGLAFASACLRRPTSARRASRCPCARKPRSFFLREQVRDQRVRGSQTASPVSVDLHRVADRQSSPDRARSARRAPGRSFGRNSEYGKREPIIKQGVAVPHHPVRRLGAEQADGSR